MLVLQGFSQPSSTQRCLHIEPVWSAGAKPPLSHAPDQKAGPWSRKLHQNAKKNNHFYSNFKNKHLQNALSQKAKSKCSEYRDDITITAQKIKFMFLSKMLKSLVLSLPGCLHVPAEALRLVFGPSVAGPGVQMAACVAPRQPSHHLLHPPGPQRI